MKAEEYLSMPKTYEDRMECLLRVQAVLARRGEEKKAQSLSEEILKLDRLRTIWRKRVEHRLQQLPDEKERLALSLRYIQGLRSEDIAESMHYCERQVYRIIKRGILHVEGLLAG